MVKEAVSPVMLTAGLLRKLAFCNLSRDCHHGKTRCHHINKVEQKKSDPPPLARKCFCTDIIATFDICNLNVISTCCTHHYRSCSSLISNVFSWSPLTGPGHRQPAPSLGSHQPADSVYTARHLPGCCGHQQHQQQQQQVMCGATTVSDDAT